MTKSNNNESVNVLVVNASILNEVSKLNKGTFAHIEYESTEKLPKSLGLGDVTKLVCGCVQMNYSYENGQNNKRKREGKPADFKAAPLKWGKWFITHKVIEHKGTFYLRFYTYKGSRMHTTYFVNGRKATSEEIALIKAYKANKAHDDSNVRVVKFEGLRNLTSGKCHYSAKVAETTANALAK